MTSILVLGLAVAGAAAQTPAPPAATCGTKDTKPCPATQPKSVADQFPFPGETPAAPAASAPDAPVSDAPVKDKFPYPGEPPLPKIAPKIAPRDGGTAAGSFPYPGENKDAPPSDGASSSSSGSAPAADPDDKSGLKDEGSEGDTRAARRRRLRPQAQKTLSDSEREAEDLTVAKFYTDQGNLQGAYLRVKDAVKVQPNDPDAHLDLAVVAEKMGKKDEAVAEYQAYLNLDPDGEDAKAAKKALAKLQH